MRSRHLWIGVLAAAVVLTTACEPAPRDIQYGHDGCAHCRMTITEQEFGSQLLNRQGRAFMFDSVECLAAYELEQHDEIDIHSMWVPDFRLENGWIHAEEAVYLRSEALRSPMGLSLSAYPDRESAEPFLDDYGGELIGWEEVKVLVEQEWMNR